MDEKHCLNIGSLYGWTGRTKFIWDTCLITSDYGTSYDIAKSSCNRFDHGHLLIIDKDNEEKIYQFLQVMKNVS